MKTLRKLLVILAIVLLPLPLLGQRITTYSPFSPAGIPKSLIVVVDQQSWTLMIMVGNTAEKCRPVELKLKITDYASGEVVFSASEITPFKLFLPLFSPGLYQISVSLSSGEYYEEWIDTAWYKEKGVGYE